MRLELERLEGSSSDYATDRACAVLQLAIGELSAEIARETLRALDRRVGVAARVERLELEELEHRRGRRALEREEGWLQDLN